MPALNKIESIDPGVQIIWRAFELRPEPYDLPDPDSEYFRKIWKESVYPLADELGRKMKMPPVKPRSRLAHEAAKWADTVDGFDVFSESIFRVYFEDGEDISRAEVLLSIAESLGLDPHALEKALELGEFTDGVIEDESEAARLGLNVVPGFIVNRKNGMTGIQSAESLQKLIDSVR